MNPTSYRIKPMLPKSKKHSLCTNLKLQKNYFILDFYRGVISFQSLLSKMYELLWLQQTTHSCLAVQWFTCTTPEDSSATGHQDGDIGPFWCQSPFQENQLATVHKQVTIVKIPERRCEAEALLWNTEKDCIRSVRGMATLWLHHASSRLTQHCTNNAPLGLQFLQWEKRAQSRHPVHPELQDASWQAPSCLASQGPLGIREKWRSGGQGLQ